MSNPKQSVKLQNSDPNLGKASGCVTYHESFRIAISLFYQN